MSDPNPAPMPAPAPAPPPTNDVPVVTNDARLQATFRFISALVVLVGLGAAYIYIPMDQPIKTILLGLIGAAVLAVEEYWKNQ